MPGFHETDELEEEGFVMLNGPVDVEESLGPNSVNDRSKLSDSDIPTNSDKIISKSLSRCPVSAPVLPHKSSISSSDSSRAKPLITTSDNRSKSVDNSSSSLVQASVPASSKRADRKPYPIQPTGAEAQTCPICGKTMETDNRGLNAHIDFCLSKEAITEAQVSASGRKPSTNVLDALRVSSPQKPTGRPGKKRKIR